jgi:hypothetical protein
MSDALCLVLMGAGALAGFALGVIVEGRLSGREIQRLEAELRKALTKTHSRR